MSELKIGMLYQNDDSGKDYTGGFLAGLGKENEKLVTAKVSYEVTDPTVDSQIIQIKNSGANVFFNDAAPKAAAQAIRKVADLGWKPAHYLANVSASVAAVLKPAGFDNSTGIITAAYLKDATDPQWADYPDFKEWQAWMKKYLPDANPADSGNSYAYSVSATMRHVLTALRRHADPREPDEAGGEHEGPRGAAAAAGHQDQHQPDRLLSDPVDPAGEVRRREVGTVRRRALERGELKLRVLWSCCSQR